MAGEDMGLTHTKLDRNNVPHLPRPTAQCCLTSNGKAASHKLSVVAEFKDFNTTPYYLPPPLPPRTFPQPCLPGTAASG